MTFSTKLIAVQGPITASSREDKPLVAVPWQGRRTLQRLSAVQWAMVLVLGAGSIGLSSTQALAACPIQGCGNPPEPEPQPQPAAVTVFKSGFETGDGSQWQFTRSGNGAGFVEFSHAHSGARKARLAMFGAGFSSVGHRVLLPNGVTKCTARAFISSELSSTRSINFEIIDPPSFTYVALRTLAFSGTTPYESRSLSWIKDSSDVLLRFSLIGENGRTTQAGIDDVKVTCQ